MNGVPMTNLWKHVYKESVDSGNWHFWKYKDESTQYLLSYMSPEILSIYDKKFFSKDNYIGDLMLIKIDYTTPSHKHNELLDNVSEKILKPGNVDLIKNLISYSHIVNYSGEYFKELLDKTPDEILVDFALCKL